MNEKQAATIQATRTMIVAAVTRELKRSAGSIASTLVDAYASEAKAGYRISVAMQFQKHER